MADKEIIRPPFRTECPGFTEGAFRFLQQVAQWINKLLTPPAWTEVTSFLNSWVNYGDGYNNAAYCKDALGFVHLRGLVKSGSVGTIFTLPIGYRPIHEEIFSCVSYTTVYVIGISYVHSDGTVTYSAGGNSFHSLDGITFYAG